MKPLTLLLALLGLAFIPRESFQTVRVHDLAQITSREAVYLQGQPAKYRISIISPATSGGADETQESGFSRETAFPVTNLADDSSSC